MEGPRGRDGTRGGRPPPPTTKPLRHCHSDLLCVVSFRTVMAMDSDPAQVLRIWSPSGLLIVASDRSVRSHARSPVRSILAPFVALLGEAKPFRGALQARGHQEPQGCAPLWAPGHRKDPAGAGHGAQHDCFVHQGALAAKHVEHSALKRLNSQTGPNC